MANEVAGGIRKHGVLKEGEKGRPLISVVMAVLNRADTIARAIESIITQSYKNVELIIVDGGSIDGTLDVLREYDTRIDYWISEPDSGIYDALNKGVRFARGDWINIQGADDCLYDSFSEVAPLLIKERTVYYGDLFYIYEKKIRFGKLTRYQLANYRFGHHRFFFPRKYFEEYTYNYVYKICADYEMVVRSFTDGRFAFEYIPVLVAEYNELDGASSHHIDDYFDSIRYSFLRSNFPLTYVLIYYFRRYLGDFRRKCMSKVYLA